MDSTFTNEGSASAFKESSLSRMLRPVCQGTALAGGCVILALISIMLISIVGRKLFNAPIQGDIELMEMGSAIAVAAFLPLCELRGLHIKADAFTMKASHLFNSWLDAISHAILFVIALILAWRTGQQMMDYAQYGDVSTLLSVPMWIPLLVIVPCLVLLALSALARMLDVLKNRKES